MVRAMANPRFDLTTIGEVMLRLSVPVGTRLEQTNALDLDPGGAEANVASVLARLGRRTAWLSALPNNPLGRLIAGSLRVAGVDLSGVRWEEGGRVGTYYVEFATPPRPIQVVYDRADSCAAHMLPEDVDWDTLLDTRLLHLTGITPAITPSCRAVVEEAIGRARRAEVPFSLDINYRARLWSTAEAAEVLRPLAEGATILFCSRGDAERVFGIRGEPGEVAQMLAKHTGALRVVISNGSEGALAWDGAQVITEGPARPDGRPAWGG
jgi:2-dehydro-3-deoxygluconokinase